MLWVIEQYFNTKVNRYKMTWFLQIAKCQWVESYDVGRKKYDTIKYDAINRFGNGTKVTKIILNI